MRHGSVGSRLNNVLWIGLALIGIGIPSSGFAQDAQASEQPEFATFNRGTYVTFASPPTSAMTLHWGSESSTTFGITIGTNPSAPADTHWESTAGTEHHFTYTGLWANTRYYYSILGTSYHGSFYTAPSTIIPFRFLAYGDAHTDQADHQSVANAMNAESNVRFALSTGDMIADASSLSDWQTFFSTEATFLANRPVMPAVGDNEDGYWTWEEHPISRLYNIPLYGSFNYSNTHFVRLNTEGDLDAQATWLASDLATARASSSITWIVAWLHRPPFSSGPGGNHDDVRDAWVPLLKQYGVDLVISAHDNDYERSYPIGGTVYVVSGGAGAPVEFPDGGASTAYSFGAHHYLVIDVNGPTLHVQVKSPYGGAFETFTLHKGPRQLRPSLAIPWIGRPGDALRFWFDHPYALASVSIRLECRGTTQNVSLYTSPVSSGGHWYVDGTIPAGTPEGLYDLVITDNLGLSDREVHAMKIINAIPENYWFIHLTDIHLGLLDAEYIGHQQHLPDVLEVVNPLFAILTGDCSFEGWRTELAQFRALAERFNVPLFVVPGNHDYQDWDGNQGYRDLISPWTQFSADIGNTHLTMLDTGPASAPLYRTQGFSPSTLTWLESDLASASAASIRFTGFHGPVFDGINPVIDGGDEFVSLCQTYNVPLNLCGHTHYNKVYDASGERWEDDPWTYFTSPIFVETASCAHSATLTPRHDVRVVYVFGSDYGAITADDDQNGERDAETSWDHWRWTVDRADFPADSHVAVVHNQHNEWFEDCRLFFDLTPGVTYDCHGANIHQTYPDGTVEVRYYLNYFEDHTIILHPHALTVEELAARDTIPTLYPNPFGEECHIRIPASVKADRLEIVDCEGRLVHAQALTPGRDLVTWRPLTGNGGIYWVRLSGPNWNWSKAMTHLGG